VKSCDLVITFQCFEGYLQSASVRDMCCARLLEELEEGGSNYDVVICVLIRVKHDMHLY